MSIVSSASGSVLITSGGLFSNHSGSVAYGPKQVSYSYKQYDKSWCLLVLL